MQNKQDIALSLSMEHKLKAEMAARSVAFEAYAHLREYGELQGDMGSLLEEDVETRVELVETVPTAHRGKMRLLRARATSGPFSSYLTLHLLPTQLSSSEDGSKVVLLPRSEQSTLAIYSDFQLTDLGQTYPSTMVASGGPAFTVTSSGQQTRPSFQGTIPVFGEAGTLEGVGPLLLLLPETSNGEQTALQWLQFKDNAFEWQTIPAPGNLAGQPASGPGTTPQLSYEMEASSSGWSHLSALSADGELRTWNWSDSSPPTTTLEEIQGSLAGSTPSQASPVTAYTTGSVQHFYLTRGAIAATGDTVYSHAWHYLYLPYRGSVPDPATPLHGAQVVRWPCVLKYSTSGSRWEVAWNPLRDDGSVASSVQPDPTSLWVDSQGVAYGLSSSEPRRLLTLSRGGDVDESSYTMPPGQVFFYQDQPHVVLSESRRLINAATGAAIAFASLPDRIPGQTGDMVFIPQGETVEEPGTNDLSPEGAFEITSLAAHTVMPDYLLNYSFGAAKPVVDGKDLYMNLNVGAEEVQPMTPVFDTDYVNKNRPQGGEVLARYDGGQWHILPQGLRTFLERKRLRPPSGSTMPTEGANAASSRLIPAETDLQTLPGWDNAVVATYPGLPKAVSRYAIVSITTDPFEMSPDAP